MLEGIEALIALERCGTISEAAVSLRLTQSAVSKRIQSLQNELGIRLTEPIGRKVILTAQAKDYVERARPLLLELKSLQTKNLSLDSQNFSLAMADSLASSWGPEILQKTLRKLPKMKISVHAHRSALIVESIRLGRYHMGLCSMKSVPADLVAYPFFSEPFVILNSELNDHPAPQQPVISIETGSATWPTIATQVQAQAFFKDKEFVRVESFSAAYQMVRAGFGNGLLPLGMIKTTRTREESYRLLKNVRRDIFLITRKNLSQETHFQEFLKVLSAQEPF